MGHHKHKGKRFENFVHGILDSKLKKTIVILFTLEH